MSVTADVLGQFRGIAVLEGLSEEQLAWFAGECRVVDYAEGEVIFHEGEPAATMFVVLEGELQARRERGEPDGRVFVRRAGEVGGMLPFSRLRNYPATGRAVGPTRLAHFPAERFTELLARIPVLEQRLVTALSDRVRETAWQDQRREKLVSLGRLAAGLAHELNNPAAAARRAAAELRQALADACGATERLARAVDVATTQRLLELRRTLDPLAGSRLDPLARSDREEQLAEWLEVRRVADAWQLAPTLIAAGVDRTWLERFGDGLPADALPAAFGWLEAVLRADELAASVENAAGRISDLVGKVKQYTYMDQASLQELDVHAGLESTLQVLAHKLRGITLVRDYAPDLPHIQGYGAELNQVWTNLLDNAADAAGPGGEIRLRSVSDDEGVCVEVRDNGPGIPAEIQSRIFDPFFTTKEVGHGTGLGLDIARRIVEQHHGSIRVVSEPGDTRFSVRLPREPRG